MDGFGMGAPGPGNAVYLANTPVLDRLFADNAHTTLSASGLDVGLPAGQMGNSEVGHTNIGGGRVVFQDLPRISRAIESGEFFKNSAYNKAMDDCLEKGTSLHLYGLLSDGGVHSTVGWRRSTSTPFWTGGMCPPPAARILWPSAGKSVRRSA